MKRVEARLELALPMWPDNLFGHLVATGVPGVEEWRDGAYRCAVRLSGGPAVLGLSPDHDHVVAQIWLTSPDDEAEAVALARFVLDLDADPVAIDARLGEDPALAALVTAAPGRRVPRISDPAQFAVRAVLGQQVSTAAARTHAARLVAAHGEPFEDPAGGLTHLFPTPAALGGVDPASLAMPRTRRRTLLGLVEALRTGAVRLDDDPTEALADLAALPGIGPWTVQSVAMRALGDRDAFLPTDLGVRKAAESLELTAHVPVRSREVLARAERWRPFRAYAVQHLWATGDHAVNRMPG